MTELTKKEAKEFAIYCVEVLDRAYSVTDLYEFFKSVGSIQTTTLRLYDSKRKALETCKLYAIFKKDTVPNPKLKKAIDLISI